MNLLQTDQFVKDSFINIIIPRIKLRDLVDKDAYINFKLLEETPG